MPNLERKQDSTGAFPLFRKHSSVRRVLTSKDDRVQTHSKMQSKMGLTISHSFYSWDELIPGYNLVNNLASPQLQPKKRTSVSNV